MSLILEYVNKALSQVQIYSSLRNNILLLYYHYLLSYFNFASEDYFLVEKSPILAAQYSGQNSRPNISGKVLWLNKIRIDAI